MDGWAIRGTRGPCPLEVFGVAFFVSTLVNLEVPRHPELARAFARCAQSGQCWKSIPMAEPSPPRSVVTAAESPKGLSLLALTACVKTPTGYGLDSLLGFADQPAAPPPPSPCACMRHYCYNSNRSQGRWLAFFLVLPSKEVQDREEELVEGRGGRGGGGKKVKRSAVASAVAVRSPVL